VHVKHAELELYTYRATNIYAAVCKTIAPSPAGFDVFMHLALNQFSWIDVTKSAIQIYISYVWDEMNLTNDMHINKPPLVQNPST
jgi:hypothetical protein